MMGPGFWLDPDTNKAYPVTRHELWLADPENLRKCRIAPQWVDALSKLNPETDAEKMKLIGVQSGMIRVRDYNNRLSVQFYAPRSRVKDVLWSVCIALPDLIKRGSEHYLTIHNLFDNSTADLWSRDFTQRMLDDQPVLREEHAEPGVTDIPSHLELQEAVARLIGESAESVAAKISTLQRRV